MLETMLPKSFNKDVYQSTSIFDQTTILLFKRFFDNVHLWHNYQNRYFHHSKNLVEVNDQGIL
jgi:hypothetical protein